MIKFRRHANGTTTRSQTIGDKWMKPANLELNLAIPLEESPRKCLHCGGIAHETIKPDGLDNLYIFTCQKCTFETHGAWRRQEAIERWNKGINLGIAYMSYSRDFFGNPATGSLTLLDRYNSFPCQIPALRTTGTPLYRVFAFGLGKIVLTDIL